MKKYDPDFKLHYIDTCLPDYLQDGHNRDGEVLLSCSLYGQNATQAAKELLADLDNLAHYNVPTYTHAQLMDLFVQVCQGLDFRPFDENGNRVNEPPKSPRAYTKEISWQNVLEECESMAYFYLEWNEPLSVSITYETVTPESAEQGDVSDRGFYELGGWKHSLIDEEFQKLESEIGRQRAIDQTCPDPYLFWSVDEAIEFIEATAFIESEGGCCALSSPGDYTHSWVTQTDGETDFTGEHTRLSFHVEGDSEFKGRVLKHFDR